jgi:hypothetical protein
MSPVFPETIEHRAKLYSLAAAAAGVGFLALAQPAQGEVIITKKTIPIPVCAPAYGDRCPVSLDLNHDGIADLVFSIGTNFGASGGFSYLSVKGVGGGAVMVDQGAHQGYVSALMRSAKIGPSAHFDNKAGKFYLMEEARCFQATCYAPVGKWGGDHPNRFVGVKFKIKGATHYGWVRMTVTTSTTAKDYVSGTITEYGYETVANKVVLAGVASKNALDVQTSDCGLGPSLGALAIGADRLAPWWRREVVAP